MVKMTEVRLVGKVSGIFFEGQRFFWGWGTGIAFLGLTSNLRDGTVQRRRGAMLSIKSEN
jgi:hypothetical protein